MKEYKGEKILAQLNARLVPPNQNYPDCICEILLSQGHLWVLEDNYDGTYETHFQFPMSQLKKMELMVENKEDQSSAPNYDSTVKQVITMLIGFLGGVIVLPGKNRESSEKTKFLAITYADGMGKNDVLFFKDLQSDSRKIINTFKACKTDKI